MIEKFVFSDELKFRITRHISYWAFFIFFILHYSIQDLMDLDNLKKIITYMPYDIASTYFLILYIAPRFLKKDHFLNLLISFILMVFLDCIINEFTEFLRTGRLNNNYFESYWSEIVYNIEFSVLLYTMPLTIKVIKSYYKNTIEVFKLEQLNKENQIKILTDQLNPHFLFNTLATIRALIGKNNDDASRVINEMSEYFRYSLISNDRDYRTFKEEIAVVKNYIEIQKIRFKSDIKVYYTIDDKTLSVMMPFLSIQTLVENAIKYGSRSDGQTLEIEIKSFLEDEKLKIKVTNTGCLNEGVLGEVSTKTGLSNLQKRLNILYPNNNSFRLYEKENVVYAEILITKIKTEHESMEYNYR